MRAPGWANPTGMGRLIPAVASLLERKPRVIRLDEKVGDSEAAYDLAVTTHRFSQRARAMVDDKLSTSAALMRAGEVAEAQRLLAEAEEDLRAEETELMRQVEELESFRSLHKPRVVVIEHPTRASLFRALTVGAAASVVIAMATMGGAVIGLFEPNSPIRRVTIPQIDRVEGQAARTIQSAAARRGVSVLINGVEVVLTRAEWRALKKAQRDGDEEALNDLLSEIAPELTVSSSGDLVEVVGQVGSALETTVDAAKREAEEQSQGSEAEASPEPTAGSESSEETTDDGSSSTEEPEAQAEEEDTSGTTDDGGNDPGSVQGELGTSIGGGQLGSTGDGAGTDGAAIGG